LPNQAQVWQRKPSGVLVDGGDRTQDALGNITHKVDEELSAIVDGFPKIIDSTRGENLLGMVRRRELIWNLW
jgi:hypothetical protein